MASFSCRDRESSCDTLCNSISKLLIMWPSTKHPRMDGPVLKQTVWLTQPDGPAMARSINVHTKQKMVCRSKAHGRLVKLGHTFDQSLFKYAKKKVILRDRPMKQLQLTAKATQLNKTRNGQHKCRLFIQ